MASTAAAPPPVVLDKVSQTLFTLTNNAVLPAWLLLAFAPTWTYTFTVVHAAALVNAVVYVFLLVSEMPESRRQAKRTAPQDQANFTSLRGVVNLFRRGSARSLLTAWVHYLAFDVLIGEMIVRDALAAGVSQWLVAPCLFLTLMFGLAGLLAYTAVRLLL